MIEFTHILKDAGAVTSSGFGAVGGSAKVLNIGAGLVRGNLVIDIHQVKISAGNEVYTLHLMGGNDAQFTETVSLASRELGASGELEGNLDSKISRVVIPFQNEAEGTIFPFVRLRHVIGGSNPSINYSARLDKDQLAKGSESLSLEIEPVLTTTTTV